MSSRFERFMRRQWGRVGCWHVVLIPLSWLFGVLSGLRRLAYRAGLLKSVKLHIPVIVVGNISVGGTGKTPLVAWLAQRLQQQGYAPAVISRGYGGNSPSVSPVFPDSDPAIVGDEPVLIARRGSWPVWVGRRRAEVARALLKAHPECNVIISDDGLQHYGLQRDVELVLVDAEYGFGNGLLLPAGPLREDRRRLKSVDAVVSHGNGIFPGAHAMRLAGEVFLCVADANVTATVQDFGKQTITAIAGIGRPERFFARLREMGLQCREMAFPDHHAFRQEDLQSIGSDVILMTEKDAVKCAAFARKNWWFLPVSAEVDEALTAVILNKLRNLNGP
jgi:tetraacyldisaccharide 4'-kinase